MNIFARWIGEVSTDPDLVRARWYGDPDDPVHGGDPRRGTPAIEIVKEIPGIILGVLVLAIFLSGSSR